MKNIVLIISVLLFSACSSNSQNPDTNTNSITNFYDLEILSLDEQSTLKMSDFKGKKILIVNVASKCGFTPQYEGLQKLNEKYGDKLQIIGFPCNQFLNQEAGTKEEIAQFCSANYGVTFPITTKINVKGSDQHSIYKWLTTKSLNKTDNYKVSWNFNKFLINERGELVGHFNSKVKPLDDTLAAAIDN